MTDASLVTATQLEEYVVAEPIGGDLYPESGRRRKRRLPLRMYVAIGWLAVVVGSAITADWLPVSPRDADACVPACIKVPPFTMWSEILGTDSFGRSILSRLIYGA